MVGTSVIREREGAGVEYWNPSPLPELGPLFERRAYNCALVLQQVGEEVRVHRQSAERKPVRCLFTKAV